MSGLDNNITSRTTLIGVKPSNVIRGQPLYKEHDVLMAASKLITGGLFFKEKGKEMSEDLNKASELLEKATLNYKDRLADFSKTCNEIDIAANKASQQLRATTEKLSQGLSRIEKSANFANLERYTLLLERSAHALSILAELDNKGKLAKISDALK
jgi:uncharacterized phage infection (PIP) family protein YhgE